jgi:hypothetical protein
LFDGFGALAKSNAVGNMVSEWVQMAGWFSSSKA